jgi:Mce-associated membrane protein
LTIGHIEDHDVAEVDEVTTDAGDGESVADSAGTEPTPDGASTDTRSRSRRVLSHWPLIVTGLLLVAAATLTAALYFGQYRTDQQTNDAAAKSAIGAASEGTVALLSYTPDKLDSDLTAAKSHLTGEFLTYYSKFADQIVAPAAKQKAVTTQATVKRAVIAELHPDSARVLVFLDQTTTSKDAAEPVQSASSVIVSLTKVHGAWLISAFDPI